MLRRIRETGITALAMIGAGSVMNTGLTMFSRRADRIENRQKLKNVTFADRNLKISVYDFERDGGIDDPEWNIQHGQELTIEDEFESWTKKVAASGIDGAENYRLLEQTLKCLAKVESVDEYDKCASKSSTPAFK